MAKPLAYEWTDGPTPERMRIANGSLHRFEHVEGGRIIATSYRVGSPVWKMFKDGHIGEPEHQAAELLYRDYARSDYQPGMVGKYSPKIDGGTTPLAQMADTDRLMPGERRVFHAARYRQALLHLKHEASAHWVRRLVCEDPIGGNEKPLTLADIGRGYCGYKNERQAYASGVTLVRIALEMLADFYGLRPRRHEARP